MGSQPRSPPGAVAYSLSVTKDKSAVETIERIVQMAPAGWGICRCDGSIAELVAYRSGSHVVGWHVSGTPVPGDLLVGTVGQGAARVIVNVNRVEGVTKHGVDWDVETDAPIIPSVSWSDVAKRTRRSARAWGRLEGRAAADFIDGLLHELSERTDTPEREGDTYLARCRRRSTRNRARKIDAANGICEGCGEDFRVGFGHRGDRALDVHHRKPLSASPGIVDTRLVDLAVLCGTCHRLVHADPDLSIQTVRLGRARMRAER